jgi:hypothetical protein
MPDLDSQENEGYFINDFEEFPFTTLSNMQQEKKICWKNSWQNGSLKIN